MLAIEKRLVRGGDAMPWRFDLDMLGGRSGDWLGSSVRFGEGDESDEGTGEGRGMSGEVVTSTLISRATSKTGCRDLLGGGWIWISERKHTSGDAVSLSIYGSRDAAIEGE